MIKGVLSDKSMANELSFNTKHWQLQFADEKLTSFLYFFHNYKRYGGKNSKTLFKLRR